jgi:protein-tyrosine-phosphatase
MSDPRPDGRPGELPGAVLFACNHNRVRSPMAEALMKLMFGDRVYVDSCGLRLDEDDDPDPFAVAVMDELGADLSRHRSKTFADLEEGAFDLVISLTPEAQHRAVELARHHAVDIEYWPTQDPTLTLGSRDAVLEAYRETRDALATRIRGRFGKAATFGG